MRAPSVAVNALHADAQLKSEMGAVNPAQADKERRQEMRIVISVHADIMCTDGDAGTSKALIVDPMQRRVTHVVVREHGLTNSERLVPTNLLDEASVDSISLQCSQSELHKLEDFVEAHFVDPPYATPALIGYWYESQMSPLVISNRVPEGEVTLGRWAVVEAIDGSVGHVDSLIVDPANYHITHIVVRTHRYLTRQEVAVPVAEVERFFSDYVMLRVSRADVARLPHVPLHEAYLLPPLAAVDQDLVAEGPQDAGVDDAEPDAPRVEGAHLLAEEVRARLRARGFTDEQILDWAKAFLRSEQSGGDAEFLSWIRDNEQASNSSSGHSEKPAVGQRRSFVFEEPANRS